MANNQHTENVTMLLHNKYVLFGIAALLHILVVVAAREYRNPNLWEYGRIARNLYEGKGFSISSPLVKTKELLSDPSTVPTPTSSQAPGYIFLLYGAWKLFGDGPSVYLVISLIQSLLTASIVFPVVLLTRRWFGRVPAAWAGCVVCVMPFYAWYSTRLTPVAIAFTFQPWLLAGWLSIERQRRWSLAIITGLATGVAGLFQPSLLGVFCLLGVWRLLSAMRRRSYSHAARLVIAAGAVLVALLPWTIRNYRIHDRFVPVKSTFGKELWLGNNPGATCTAVTEGGQMSLLSVCPPKCMSDQNRIPEIELMDAIRAEAVEHIHAEPIAFMKRSLTKFCWFWTVVPRHFVVAGGGRDIFHWVAYCWILLLVLACIARASHGPLPREYRTVLLMYFLAYSILHSITHVGEYRYRGEIEYVVLPAVGLGVTVLWNKLLSIRRL